MATKLCEHTYGTSAFMRVKLDDGFIGEITTYFREKGETYRTNADDNEARRNAIIQAWKDLY